MLSAALERGEAGALSKSRLSERRRRCPTSSGSLFAGAWVVSSRTSAQARSSRNRLTVASQPTHEQPPSIATVMCRVAPSGRTP
jgi:hypothetical protein